MRATPLVISDFLTGEGIKGRSYVPLDSLFHMRFVCERSYFPTINKTNDPGTMLGRGCGRSGVGGGGGPNSAVTRKILCVFGSSVIVRAPLCVATFSMTLNLSAESS